MTNPRFTYPAVVARAIHEETGRPPDMTMSFFDLKAAFKSVPTSQPCLTVVAVWDPKGPSGNDVVFYDHPGHPFGLGASVLIFAQYAELVSLQARTFCGLAVEHYVDDFLVPDLATGRRSGERCLRGLINAFGAGPNPPLDRMTAPRLDAKKDKPAALVNEGLGVQVNLTRLVSHSEVRFEPTARRRKRVLQDWDDAYKSRRMPRGDAAKLAGRRGFLMETAPLGGRAASLPLYDRQHSKGGDESFTPAMHAAREFDAVLLGGDKPRLPPLVLHLAPDARPPVLIYTDAAFKWRRKRSRDCDRELAERDYVPRDDPLPQPWQFDARLGLVIYDPVDAFFEASEGQPDDDTVRYYLRQNRRTYIAQLEALAMLTPFTTYPARLAGRRVIHFVDNAVALSGMVHGYARDADLAVMVNAYHLMSTALRARPYLDYVASKANIADLPSRGEYGVPRMLGANARPDAMTVPPYAWLSGPLYSWYDRAAVHARPEEGWPM